MNNLSTVYMLSICLVLYIASLDSICNIYPLNNVITLILTIFIVSRLAVISLYPESLLGSRMFDSSMFNHSLLFILCGMISCFLGTNIGFSRRNRDSAMVFGNTREISATRLRNGRTVEGRDEETSPKMPKEIKTDYHMTPDYSDILLLSVLAITVTVIFMINYRIFGYVGATGSGEHSGFYRRYISRFANPKIMFLLLIVSYDRYTTNYQEQLSRIRKPLISVAILYFVQMTLSGSRGGAIEILFLLFSSGVFIKGNFHIELSFRRVVLLVLVFIVLIYVYLWATILREAQWRAGDYSLRTVGTVSSLALNQMIYEHEILIRVISYRLSFIDNIMHILNAEKLGHRNIDDVVNYKTTFLSTINRIVPGKPFKGILFSEYAFGIMVGNKAIVDHAGRSNYVGYEWSMFGISYQLFGFVGGIVFIFIVSLLLGFSVRFCKLVNSTYGYCFGVLAVYTIIMWLKTFGIDNLADRTFHSVVILALYMLVFRLLTIGVKSLSYSQRIDV